MSLLARQHFRDGNLNIRKQSLPPPQYMHHFTTPLRKRAIKKKTGDLFTGNHIPVSFPDVQSVCGTMDQLPMLDNMSEQERRR
jgi:hypothetical protein